jgi:uncharacterized protein (DUF362 family)
MPLTRRAALKLGLAASAAAALPGRAFAAGYRVGVGRDADAYHATRRAIESSGEWPALSVPGRTVVIKPNIVSPRPASSGATTDPEVVRAIVDQALADGASAVQIVEGSPDGAYFTECGYDFFSTYDADGRVQLVDLGQATQVMAPLSGGMVYGAVSMPELVLGGDRVFVSVGKLKTHGDSVASLTMKNLFGLPTVDKYISYLPIGRFAMHDRSMHQTVVDLNRLRPVDFAVLDGIWGMEGAGPLYGSPVRMDTVLAGANALAVDRVALSLMGLPQWAVRHLDYGAAAGLGPLALGDVVITGDAIVPRAFVLPKLPPYVEYPRVSPASFRPSAGQKTNVGIYYYQQCIRVVDILRLFDDRPAVELIKTLKPYGSRAQGSEFLVWDGRAEDGTLAPPGRYAAHVRAFQPTADGRPMDGIAWVTVAA